MRFYKRAGYWRWAREQDAVALDIYPNPGQDDSRVSASLNFDLMRSLRGEPWLLMEQAASAVSQWKVNNPKRPGRMRLGSYQAIAHGADSVLFFQWRASRGSHERFHSAMLPHSGTSARTWKEVVALGNELPRIAETVGTTATADWWQDSIHPETAQVLATYASGDLAGRAAVLRNERGSGRVIYLGTRLDAGAFARTVLGAAADAGIAPVVADTPEFVEAARRASDTAEYLFLLNHSDAGAATVPVAPGGTDLITGTQVSGPLTLQPLAVAVLAYPRH